MTSTIKVDNIQKVSDASNIIKKCSATTTVGSGSGNTVVVCGSTVTIGRCGGTVSLASGATQTGFGRTGTVDWQTGSIKTTTFTAVNGEGYFVNTAGGAVTCNLPAGSAGAIVSVQDYNNTFDTYALTISPNGSEKINGGSASGILELSTEGQGLTLVYVDSTVGWRAIEEQTYATKGSNAVYVVASATGCTGPGSGCIVDTDYKVHIFNGPGTLTVSCAGNACGSNKLDYMVVAGGGGGSGEFSGAGAGGFRESVPSPAAWTGSPLANPGAGITAAVQAYPITVGGGGAANGTDGDDSVFATITSTGGGGGGGGAGNTGGSGAGGAAEPAPANAGGAGNTPPTSPPQGQPGGDGANCGGTGSRGGGGGGGATAAGGSGSPSSAGAGGAGATTCISGSPVARAGGGAGGEGPPQGSVPGGTGGGGNFPAGAGTCNTGGGGAGKGRPAGTGGNGGSGIVIIRYKFQN